VEVVAGPPGVTVEDMEVVVTNSLQCTDHIHQEVEALGVAMEHHLEEDMEPPQQVDMGVLQQQDMEVHHLDMEVHPQDMEAHPLVMEAPQLVMEDLLLEEAMAWETVNYRQEVAVVMFKINSKL